MQLNSQHRKQPQSEGAEPLTIEDVFTRVVRREFERLHIVERLVVDIDEVSEMLGVSVSGVRNLAAEGKLHPVDLDSRMRFNMREVVALAEKRKAG